MNRRLREDKKPTDKILTEWDMSISSEGLQKLAGLSGRRLFLTGMFRTGVILAGMPLWPALSACDRQAAQRRLSRQQPWQTFAAVQQQLFPADGDGPSARDINATLYLKSVLEATDTEAGDRAFLLDGIKWLNALTDKQFHKAFVALDVYEQDKALQTIATSSAGERWLSQLILYIMEALLTDPVYGGNPDTIGWRWLQHQAGFPRPPRNKRYQYLL